MLPISRIVIAVLMSALWLIPALSSAQSYPMKPIRLVSPFPPGGANDIVARVVASKLGAAWEQSVIVENRPGAAGAVGSALVAKAAPDGYTLVMGTLATHGINASTQSLPYDPVGDFAPVTLVARIPIVLVVNPSLPAQNIEQFISLAKSRPGQLNFASSGTGSVNHLAGELFKSMAQVNMVHVGYKGSAPALTDLLGGQVVTMFDLLPSSLPHINSGRLRALAVTSAERSSLLQNVPTMAESGLTGYEANSWFGIFAPARTPGAIVEKLNSEIVGMLKTPDVRERLAQQGAEPIPSTPAVFAQVVRDDLEKWARVVKALGITK